MWYSEASVDENDQYRIVIERAPHDPAAKTVPFSCAQCGLQYMTLVRLGRSMRTMLVCECGAMSEYADVVNGTATQQEHQSPHIAATAMREKTKEKERVAAH